MRPTEEHHCRHCEVVLVPEVNWSKSNVARLDKQCKACGILNTTRHRCLVAMPGERNLRDVLWVNRRDLVARGGAVIHDFYVDPTRRHNTLRELVLPEGVPLPEKKEKLKRTTRLPRSQEEGWVYIIWHPAWPNKVTFGYTTDPRHRLPSYFTAWGEIDGYQVHWGPKVVNPYAHEQRCLKAAGARRDGSREWCFMDMELAMGILLETTR